MDTKSGQFIWVFGLVLLGIFVVTCTVILTSDYLTSKFVHWDEQSLLSISGNYTLLAYNVTAVVQNSTNGYGIGYFLNGATDNGNWYQFGLEYNWPRKSNTITLNGFRMAYEIWNGGNSIYPKDGGAGGNLINGTIDNGDTVLLKMALSNKNVSMTLYDWNTGAHANLTYSALNATKFVGYGGMNGTHGNGTNQLGELTGLMTEEEFVNFNYTNGKQVTYKITNKSFEPEAGTMMIQEKCITPVIFACGFGIFNNQLAFRKQVNFRYLNGSLQTIQTHNATLASNKTEFITGT